MFALDPRPTTPAEYLMVLVAGVLGILLFRFFEKRSPKS